MQPLEVVWNLVELLKTGSTHCILIFLSKKLSNRPHEVGWTPLQALSSKKSSQYDLKGI